MPSRISGSRNRRPPNAGGHRRSVPKAVQLFREGTREAANDLAEKAERQSRPAIRESSSRAITVLSLAKFSRGADVWLAAAFLLAPRRGGRALLAIVREDRRTRLTLSPAGVQRFPYYQEHPFQYVELANWRKVLAPRRLATSSSFSFLSSFTLLLLLGFPASVLCHRYTSSIVGGGLYAVTQPRALLRDPREEKPPRRSHCSGIKNSRPANSRLESR